MKNLILILALFIASCGDKAGVPPPSNSDLSGPGPTVYGRLAGSEVGTYIPFSADTAKVPTIATQNYVLSSPFFKNNGGIIAGAVSLISKTTNHKLWIVKYDSGNSHTDAPKALTSESQYVHIGGREYGSNTYRTIGFGYTGIASDISPVAIGIQEKNTGGNTNGDLIFATRNVTSNTAPIVRLRVDVNGQIIGEGTYTPSTDQSLATKKYIDSYIKSLQSQIDSLKKK